MRTRYHIDTTTERDHLTDRDIAALRDPKRLIYAYHRATKPLYKRPLYKDPKAFVAILMIVLLAIFIAEVVEKEEPTPPVPGQSTTR